MPKSALRQPIGKTATHQVDSGEVGLYTGYLADITLYMEYSACATTNACPRGVPESGQSLQHGHRGDGAWINLDSQSSTQESCI